MRRDRNIKGRDSSRDSGPFVALPWSVLDSAAYMHLSHPAKALLMELARQYVRDNNGRLLASRTYLGKRGWTSADTISRALRELIAVGLIHQTVQGYRPNKASWYALTWRTLDRLPGYDAGAAESFERSAYAKQHLKSAGLIPRGGLVTRKIGPASGPGKGEAGPPNGPMETDSTESPSPPNGHHLDKPSPLPELRWRTATNVIAEHASLTHREVEPGTTLPRGSVGDAAIHAEGESVLTFEQLGALPNPANITGRLTAAPASFIGLGTAIIDRVSHD